MNDKSWTIEIVLREGQVQMRLRENAFHSRGEFANWQKRAIEIVSGAVVLIGLRDLLSYL